jgi:hypothetical protein
VSICKDGGKEGVGEMRRREGERERKSVALCLLKANCIYKCVLFYLLLNSLQVEVHMKGEMRRYLTVSVSQ